MSLDTFKTNYLPKDKLVNGCSSELYPFLKESYFGGICEVYTKRPREGELLYYHDINSAYPHVMRRKMPVKVKKQQPYHVPIALLGLNPNTLSEQKLYGVLDLTWSDDTKYPTIPRRTDQGLVYRRKNNTVLYIWGEELMFALKTGKIVEGMITSWISFEWADVFTNYINTIYEKRKPLQKALS